LRKSLIDGVIGNQNFLLISKVLALTVTPKSVRNKGHTVCSSLRRPNRTQTLMHQECFNQVVVGLANVTWTEHKPVTDEEYEQLKAVACAVLSEAKEPSEQRCTSTRAETPRCARGGHKAALSAACAGTGFSLEFLTQAA
jgi:hypothetical protein